MTIKSIEDKDIVFFLGAGASVKAGVPTTLKFVRDFETTINDERLSSLFKKIKNTLMDSETDEERNVDIEAMMEALDSLTEYIESEKKLFHP